MENKRLILRRKLESPAERTVDGKTLREWRAACTHRMRFTGLSNGDYFCLGDLVCKKVDSYRAYVLADVRPAVYTRVGGHTSILAADGEDVL